MSFVGACEGNVVDISSRNANDFKQEGVKLEVERNCVTKKNGLCFCSLKIT